MQYQLSNIQNNVQDRTSKAWKKLCSYIDELAENGGEEFAPREILGDQLFSEIYTLPASIAKLKKVKKVWLYGSQLKRIPPEIGEMESLEFFDPYTSYDLHWFPYEITNCMNLKNSRISTRALYGNYKFRNEFPDLRNKPLRYFGKSVCCSICKKETTYNDINQVWISLRIGTDEVPLLANLCSSECEDQLPIPAADYVQFPHKGGAELVQPLDEGTIGQMMMEKYEDEDEDNENEMEPIKEVNTEAVKAILSEMKPLKLIKKIWNK